MLMFQQPNYVQLHILLFRLFNLLLNMNFSTSFYVYILDTPLYRHYLNPSFQRITNGWIMT